MEKKEFKELMKSVRAVYRGVTDINEAYKRNLVRINLEWTRRPSGNTIAEFKKQEKAFKFLHEYNAEVGRKTALMCGEEFMF